MTGWPALAGSVLLGSCAQISLKRGLGSSGMGNSRLRSPWVLGWAASFALATALWFAALAHMPVSHAYPALGAGYILVALLARVFLGERIPARRGWALALVALGVAVAGGSR